MRGCGSTLCRAPPQLLPPSQALGEEKEQQLKSTNCDCPGPRALVCPSDQTCGHKDQAGYLPCSWRIRETLEAAGDPQTRLKGKEQKCSPQQLCHAARSSPGTPG